jgi:hypothetical protein
MCSGICTTEKSFPTEKLTFISLSSVRFTIFHKNLQQCLDPNPNPNFFRIRIQPKYSDSFEHWYTVYQTPVVAGQVIMWGGRGGAGGGLVDTHLGNISDPPHYKRILIVPLKRKMIKKQIPDPNLG